MNSSGLFSRHCSRSVGLYSSSQLTPQLTWQNNEHLRGALLVGILRVAKAGWLSGVINLKVSQFFPFITLQLSSL
jgi:hypothetical protein